MFAVMSISERAHVAYFELLSFRRSPRCGPEARGLRRTQSAGHQVRAGSRAGARFHECGARERAQRNFTARVSEKAVPDDLRSE